MVYQKKNWDNSPRSCPICGKEFIPTQPNNIYCSFDCMLKRPGSQWDNSPRKCRICGKKFIPTRPNNIYCSFDCGKKASRSRVESKKKNWDNSPRDCPICGKEFIPTQPNNIYCSFGCGKKALRSRVESKKKKWDNSPRDCPICGKGFIPTQPNNIYCSSDCMLKKPGPQWDNSPRNCRICGKEFIPTRRRKIYIYYCSSECRKKASQWDNSPRNCPICGKEFIPTQPNNIYCSSECRKKAFRSQEESKKKNWADSPRNCRICGKEFIPDHAGRIYCSPVCAKNASQEYHNVLRTKAKSKKRLWADSPRNCPICGKEFIPTQPKNIYCSSECRNEQNRRANKMLYVLKKPSPNIIEGKPIYTNFNELIFWNEKQFEKWFKKNYAIFGLKTLRKINRLFPDVIAETYDGKILRIELELCAPNFVAHGHDPTVCDLIISFVKPFGRNNIRGIPIIAIFNAKGLTKGLADYDPESLKLTDYFEKIVTTLNSYLLEFLTKPENVQNQ